MVVSHIDVAEDPGKKSFSGVVGTSARLQSGRWKAAKEQT